MPTKASNFISFIFSFMISARSLKVKYSHKKYRAVSAAFLPIIVVLYLQECYNTPSQIDKLIRIKPQDYSMYPLFIPGRDEALIQQASVTDCRRNDVVLYRRDQSILVLHRINKITEEGFFMVGDNQWEIEGK